VASDEVLGEQEAGVAERLTDGNGTWYDLALGWSHGAKIGMDEGGV
jgi:hypothetical protein